MATVRVLHPPARPRPEPPDRSRHLRVVRPERARRPAFRLTPKTGVVLTVLLFVALFGVAVSHTLLIESQIELDALDEEVAGEQARYEELRRTVADLESPDRIMAEARDLGMVPPEDVVWLTPDEPAPPGDGGEGAGTSDTSWADVKPYLESTP